MMTSRTISTTYIDSSTLMLKPIFGEGREKRLDQFQEIIKQANPAYAYGSMTKFMRKAKEKSDYKCRLLYEGENPIGVLLYHIAPSKKLANALTIKLLHADHLDQWSASHKEVLLKELFYTAKDNGLNYLSAKVPLQDVKAIAFFQANEFSKSLTLSKEDYAIYYRAIPSTSSSGLSSSSSDSKRKRVEREERDKTEDDLEKSNDEKRVRTDTGQYRTQSRTSSASSFESISSSIPGATIPTIRRASEVTSMPKLPPKQTTCSIQRKYLHFIMNGSKSIEGRINSGIFAKLRVGEHIKFFCGNESVISEITALKPYDSFADMLEKEGVERCLPDIKSLKAAIDVYNNIPRYAQKADQFGVLAIHLKKITQTNLLNEKK